MQLSSKKILALLAPERPAQVRRAALVVLRSLGERDGELTQAVYDCLQDADGGVRQEAIQAAGQLRVDKALTTLLGKIEDGGTEGELAAHAAAKLGVKGTRALQDLMHKVAPGVRRYIGAALASGGPVSDHAAGLHVLRDNDRGVVEAAAKSLSEQIPSMSSGQRKAWTEELVHLLQKSKPAPPAATRAAAIRLLAALNDARAAAVFWDHTQSRHPPEVRALALQALAQWSHEPKKEHLHRLFTCANDSDFRVAAPALMFLKHLDLKGKSAGEWLTLLHAPDAAIRVVALEKLAGIDTAPVAAALAEQLDHPERPLRDKALAALTRLKHGRDWLTKALFEATDAEQAWYLAKAQVEAGKKYPAAWRTKVFQKACELLEAENRLGDPLLYLLRHTDAADLRDRLEDKALAFRKKKNYPTALLYLRNLTRDPACAFAIKAEAAACGLKLSSKELTHEARANDHCLDHFAGLCRNYEKELVQFLSKATWLDPEDLFYLGFHFAEKENQYRRFAGEVLRLVLKRSAKSKIGQAARSKLRSAGLE
ncbi:MAG: HEAT repeat domain-containing protein [Gemmataceae bacterium]|nr:HEAT repeat domain-containing protein [Gemmataceae bacterium]